MIDRLIPPMMQHVSHATRSKSEVTVASECHIAAYIPLNGVHLPLGTGEASHRCGGLFSFDKTSRDYCKTRGHSTPAASFGFWLRGRSNTESGVSPRLGAQSSSRIPSLVVITFGEPTYIIDSHHNSDAPTPERQWINPDRTRRTAVPDYVRVESSSSRILFELMARQSFTPSHSRY
jgi:hypothetical protein